MQFKPRLICTSECLYDENFIRLDFLDKSSESESNYHHEHKDYHSEHTP